MGLPNNEGSEFFFTEAAVRISIEFGVCLLASASESCKSATSSLGWDIRGWHFGVGMFRGFSSNLQGHVGARFGSLFYKFVRDSELLGPHRCVNAGSRPLLHDNGHDMYGTASKKSRNVLFPYQFCLICILCL